MTRQPRTTIEFIDRTNDPGNTLAHIASEVRINGTPVLVARDSIDVECGDNEATAVTLTLLPTKVHFIAAQREGETAMPKSEPKPTRPYPNLPKPPSTMSERIEALQEAKPLLSSQSFISSTGAQVLDLIRVAEYITTGHDYLDTHPCEEESADTESQSP